MYIRLHYWLVFDSGGCNQPVISLLQKKTYVLLFVVYFTMKKYKNHFLLPKFRIFFVLIYVRDIAHCAVNIM